MKIKAGIIGAAGYTGGEVNSFTHSSSKCRDCFFVIVEVKLVKILMKFTTIY
ncbi:MAG: hypothetical protein R2801_05650 [Chitinophagales bacterium]